MSAQKSKKGIIFLFPAFLLVFACNNSVNINEPSQSSSSLSSSSEVVGSSSSVAAGSSDSGPVTLTCTGLQATVEKGGTIAVPTLTCSNGSQATNPTWTGRPQSNASWTVLATTTTTSYTIGANATCGSVSNLTATCGTVTVGTGTSTSSNSVVATSSSSRVVSSSSSLPATGAVSSSSQAANATCSFARGQTKDIQYIPNGTSGLNTSKHKLNLTLPAESKGNGPFPLVIFLHGGAFAGGDRTDSPGASGKAPDNGYALVSIGYRLSGDAGGTFPGSFNDILTAIRFLRANADTYCLDPDRFAVTGFSAGAYHAGMVCVLSGYDDHGLDGWPTLYQGQSTKVQACATYAALTDMSKLAEHEKLNTGITYMIPDHGGTSPEAKFLGINAALNTLPETAPPNASVRWKANSLNYVTTKTPPIWMIHATNDNVVPWQQSEILVNKINSVVSGRATFDKQSTGGHSGFDSRADSVFAFFKRNLK